MGWATSIVQIQPTNLAPIQFCIASLMQAWAWCEYDKKQRYEDDQFCTQSQKLFNHATVNQVTKSTQSKNSSFSL